MPSSSGVVELIGGFVNAAAAAVLGVSHPQTQRRRRSRWRWEMSVARASSSARSWVSVSMVAVVEHIAHALAFQGPGHLAPPWWASAPAPGPVPSRWAGSSRGYTPSTAFRHGVGGLDQCRGAHGHVLAVPRALRPCRAPPHRDTVSGQILRAAPASGSKRAYTLQSVFRQRVGAVRPRRAAAASARRRPVLCAAAVAGILIDIHRDVR